MIARFRLKSTGKKAAAVLIGAVVVCASASTSVLAQTKAPEKTKAADKSKAPAQQAAPAATPAPAVPATMTATAPAVTAAAGVPVAPDYVIGSDDVLSVVFWRDKELSTDVTVRPDGNISIPLINDVHAAGLTPAQLKDRIAEEAKKYIEDPSVTVVVKEIKSRKVFITGEVRKPGPYSLTGGMSVLQLISVAGGLADYAKPEKISIVRTEAGKPQSFKFNYKEVLEGKKLAQNIELKPGDTVIVP
jgi:polysaccharide export outer membrane protein